MPTVEDIRGPGENGGRQKPTPKPKTNGEGVQKPRVGSIADGKQGQQGRNGQDSCQCSGLLPTQPVGQESGELADKQGDAKKREDGNTEHDAVSDILRKFYLVS